MNRSKPMRRVALKQGTKALARCRPLPLESPKTRARKRDRAKTVAETRMRAGDRCQAQVVTCTPWLLDTHEILTRGRGGSPYDPSNTMLACRACHQWITEHPTEAEERGWVLASKSVNLLRYKVG